MWAEFVIGRKLEVPTPAASLSASVASLYLQRPATMPEMSELTPALFPKGALVELHGLSGRADLNGAGPHQKVQREESACSGSR